MFDLRKIKEIREDTWALIILFVCLIYLFSISLISVGLYGDTDSITHYQIARYAFKYPWLLVHHWGKPLFTILSAPFAQFGLQGSIFFNIFCGLLSAWQIYRIAKELNFRYALAVIPFSLFAPVYMITLFTSLTEILFCLVLVAGIYYFLKQKSILSAIIISFIPYARTEGIMFLVIFLLAFILVKKFKAIPFLFTGYIIYSLVGYLHYKDLFWFFTTMPYGEKGSAIYGSGRFWYYIVQFHTLMGWPLLILAVLGVIYLIIRIYKDKKSKFSTPWVTQNFLIMGSFFLFILVHSFLWWQGMLGVLGSKRFMACIMPLGGFLAIMGLNFILMGKNKPGWIKPFIISFILGSVLISPYIFNDIPAPLVKENLVMKKTAEALKIKGFKEDKIIYSDPKLPFFMNANPFALNGMRTSLPDPSKPTLGLAEGQVVVWDTHFSEFEERLLLTELLDNPNFQVIDGFVPDQDYAIFQGQNYMSLIFQRKKIPALGTKWLTIDSLNFESLPNDDRKKYYSDAFSINGKYSYRVDSTWVYSPSIFKNLSEFSSFNKIIVRASVKVYIPEGAEIQKVILVFSIFDANGKIYRYLKMKGTYFKLEKEKWSEIFLLTPVMTNFPIGGSLKAYVWYPGKGEIYIDNLVVEYLSVLP